METSDNPYDYRTSTEIEIWQPARRVKKTDVPFDVGACENDALNGLLVKATMSNGWPRSRAAIVLSMVNREFRDLVRAEFDAHIDNLQKMYEEWRSLIQREDVIKRSIPRHGTIVEEQKVRLKEASAAVRNSKTGFIATLQKLVGEQSSNKCINYIQNGHKNDPNFSWTITRTHLSSMILRICMACAGKRMKCSNAPGSSSSTWMMVHGQHLYAKQKCWDWMSIKFSPAGDPLGWHDGIYKPKEIDAAHETGCLARAMLRQAEIYDSSTQGHLFQTPAPVARIPTSAAAGELHPSHAANNSSYNAPLCLEKHLYIPLSSTLQGRLGLNQVQIRLAYEDQHATLKLMQDEKRAIQAVRVAKFRKDVDMWFKAREMQGLEELNEVYEKFGHTLDRLLRLHDPADPKNVHRINDGKNRYISALQIPVIKDMCRRMQQIVLDIVPTGEKLTGKAVSVHALEWAANFYSGILEGPHGPWRSRIDGGTYTVVESIKDLQNIATGKGEKSENELWAAYTANGEMISRHFLAAVHIFDFLGTSDYEIDVSCDTMLPPRPQWYIKCKGGMTISGHLPKRTHDDMKQVHKMILSAFQHYKHLNMCGDMHCHRECPSQSTLNKALRGSSEEALEAYVMYYKETANLLNMFNELRAVAMYLLGIYPEVLVQKLYEEDEAIVKNGTTFLARVIAGTEKGSGMSSAQEEQRGKKRALDDSGASSSQDPKTKCTTHLGHPRDDSDDDEEEYGQIVASFAAGL